MIDHRIFNGKDGKSNESTHLEIMKYISSCESEGRVPTKTGCAIYLGVTRQTLDNWSKKWVRDAEEDFENIHKALDMIMAYQEEALIQRGLKNEYNSTIVKLMLANHGYADRMQNLNIDATQSDEGLKLLRQFADEDSKAS